MLRFANWKLASVLALVAAAVLVILPSFMPAQTVDALAARFPSFIPLRQIVLGLDLQGGAYLLMEVDTPSVVKSQVEALRDDVRQKLREGKIAISGGIAVEPRAVVVRIADPAATCRQPPDPKPEPDDKRDRFRPIAGPASPRQRYDLGH